MVSVLLSLVHVYFSLFNNLGQLLNMQGLLVNRIDFKVAQMMFERFARKSCQKHKVRLLHFDDRRHIQILNVGSKVLHHLYAVLAGHLKIEEHQAHWHD